MTEDVKNKLFNKAVNQPTYFKRLYDDLCELQIDLKHRLYDNEGELDFQVVQALAAASELIFYLSYTAALDAAASIKAAAVKVDPHTGAELSPGRPELCEGNGKHPDFEICCDNCDYFLACFPEYDER